MTPPDGHRAEGDRRRHPPDRDPGTLLGIDLGGTKLRAALADADGTIRAEIVEPAAGGPVEAIVAQVWSVRSTLASLAGVAPAAVRSAGLGLPIAIDPRSGRAWSTGNVPGLEAVVAAEVFGRALGVPVVVENDANCAALGEGRLGAAAGETDYAVVAVGTGIGCGIVSGGRLLRGARGGAGEIAFLPLGEDPWTERSRALGAYEAAVAGPAILERLEAAFAEGEPTTLAVASGLTAIAEAAAAGDALAARLLDDEGRLLAVGIAALAAVVDPAVVVLSGGVGAVAGLVPSVRAHTAALCAHPPRIVGGLLGERAPLIGALGLARDALAAGGPVRRDAP